MSTPRSRARWLRGALVGATSAVVATSAHTAPGGGLPQGSALAVALLVCATAGAVVGSFTLDGRRSRPMGVVTALCVAQLVGHLVLVAAGGQHHHDHHHSGMGLTPSMLAAHALAAVVLGAVIAAAEYLYVVCSSMLCWLRLFATRAPEPASASVCRVPNIVVAQSVLRCPGLGMRAPPGWVATAA